MDKARWLRSILRPSRLQESTNNRYMASCCIDCLSDVHAPCIIFLSSMSRETCSVFRSICLCTTVNNPCTRWHEHYATFHGYGFSILFNISCSSILVPCSLFLKSSQSIVIICGVPHSKCYFCKTTMLHFHAAWMVFM